MEDSSNHTKTVESDVESATAKLSSSHQKPRLEVLPNDSSSSSASSSPVNAELDEIIKNQDKYRNSYFEQYKPSASGAASSTVSLTPVDPLMSDLGGRRSSSRDSVSSYCKRTSSASTYGMRRTLLTGPILYENAMAEDLQVEVDEQAGRCHDCSRSTHLNKFGDVDLCDNCTQKRWQIEVNELVKVKSYIENTAEEMKKYLSNIEFR
jgi:hypothetical protein